MRNAAPPGEGPHIQLGLKKGYLRETNGHILYVACGKKYKAADPEESVRAAFYVQLIEKYQYPPERIDVEVEVPRRTPSDYADIVVYSDDQSKSPFIVVECKREGLSHKETNQGIEQAFGNANSVRARYAVLVAGTTLIAFDVGAFRPGERQKNVVADLPIHYGKPRKFRF